MNRTSRRALARWAADQLADGQPVSKTARSLAAVLAESKMADQAGFLIEDITWELEHRGILTVAKVTSASPLPKQLAAALEGRLRKITGSSKVAVRATVDRSVVGGIRIETADKVWDQTVKHQLSELREAF